MTDPYGTAELRRRVLDAWTASPARFREDANAEEDHALGGYRDRVIVELAQNAADAAFRAGVPGHLRLDYDGRTLTAANTGAPLDAEGVAALSTLRASAKRDDAQVGRFGVGFAAVVAVTDEPSIASTTGAVAWSRARTAAEATAVPSLASELAARDGHVPVLRLPYESAETPPSGYTTTVRLPLRDDAARDLVAGLLAATGPALLLALPSLRTVEIHTPDGTRTLTAHAEPAPAHGAPRAWTVVITADDAVSRWWVTEDSGELGDALLADRPVEERARRAWFVRWAVSTDDAGRPTPLPDDVPAVLHAPTPSDEPLSLPALLLASFPLAPDRRHTAPGPLTDFLTERAADAYAAALAGLPRDPGVLDLVPVGLASGELDAAVRRAIGERLPATPFLPGGLRPRDAVAITGGPDLLDNLAPALPGLLPPGWPATHPALRALGVRHLETADLADLLADLDRDPEWWHSLYAALGDAPVDALGALPVPLADGRLVRGPRGLLLPTDPLRTALPDPDALTTLGLRVVHPAAAHPLLARLGATEATPRSVLDTPAVRGAVADSYESALANGPDGRAEAVLSLVAAAGIRPGELPWLGELALPAADGEYAPAEELLLPGAPLAEVLGGDPDDAPFGEVAADLVDRFGTETLEAVGALWTFTALHAEDVPLDAVDLDLDAVEEWADDLAARLDDPVPPVVPELLAVRDLELVDPDRWPRALELLDEPPLRAALRDPVRVLRGDGSTADLPSYTGWWLARHPILNGHRPGDLRLADADDLLAGLYPPAPPGLDPELARALGVRTTLAALLAEPGGLDELLDRLADPALPVARDQLRDLYTEIATAQAPAPPRPPGRVRAVRDGAVVVADAADTVVLDAPDLLPLLDDCALILAPWPYATRLAEMLDLPPATDEIAGAVTSTGTERPVPEAVRLPDGPETYVAHDRLTVDGIPVTWRYADGVLHATGDEGLARGIAWAAGAWPARYRLGALLRDPDAAPTIHAEADLEP